MCQKVVQKDVVVLVHEVAPNHPNEVVAEKKLHVKEVRKNVRVIQANVQARGKNHRAN